MFTKSIAVFVAAVVLVTVSPAMAQSSSDLLASIERVVLTTEVEQDQSVVRRRRSGGLAWTGGGLVVAGIVLALRPPVCELLGSKEEMTVIGGFVATHEFEAIVAEDGTCDVVRFTEVDIVSYEDYWSSSPPERLLGRAPITKKTWNYVGWATAAAGGVLMWYGLRSVDVPVRFDVAPTGGFRVSRSLGW